MKSLNVFWLSMVLALSLASCQQGACDFEVGHDGILETTESGTYLNGTHYMGDTTHWAGHSVFVCYDSSINLDDYVGKDVTIHGNYIHEQSLNNPRFIEVIRIYVN